jgi:hypothetical protein
MRHDWIIGLGLLGLPWVATGQGALTPPAAPAPLMKTLAQLEPRHEVNAVNTPGNSSALFRITAAGSYYVSQTLTGATGKAGIVIAADDVTLDLNGGALVGVPGSLAGIAASGSPVNLRVRGGTVRGWGGAGLDLAPAKQVQLEQLCVADNGGDGARAGENALIQDCTMTGNGGKGVAVAVGGIVRACVARNNGSTGIAAGQETLVLDCVTQQNGASGIEFIFLGIADGCVARENGRHGIETANAAIIRHCVASSNTSNGVAAVSSYLLRNTANNNHTGLGASGGLTVDNQCIGNYPGAGIQSTSYLFRNNCSGNGTNYSDDGSCQAITNLCPIAVTNPWMNFH